MQPLPKIVYQSLEPITQDAEYNGKQLRLVELDAQGLSDYRSAQSAGMKLGPEGTPIGVINAGEIDPLIVTLSLREVKSDGSTSKVGRAYVNTLHPRFIRQLADAAREINREALNEGATVESLDAQIAKLTELRDRLSEDSAKNSRPATTASSV
jgi:hypothetical protein